MPTRLPTDTAHLRLPTRQYELMGKRLGHGFERRKITLTAAVAVPWWGLLLLIGITPAVSISAWIVPVALMYVLGTRTDASGRMAVMSGYDWLLSRRARRRRALRNPAVPAAAARRPAVRISAITDITGTDAKDGSR